MNEIQESLHSKVYYQEEGERDGEEEGERGGEEEEEEEGGEEISQETFLKNPG